MSQDKYMQIFELEIIPLFLFFLCDGRLIFSVFLNFTINSLLGVFSFFRCGSKCFD